MANKKLYEFKTMDANPVLVEAAKRDGSGNVFADKYVTRDTNQTISGVKTFESGKLKVGTSDTVTFTNDESGLNIDADINTSHIVRAGMIIVSDGGSFTGRFNGNESSKGILFPNTETWAENRTLATLDDFSALTTEGSESVTLNGDTLNIVTRDTNQTITGEKTFKNDIIIKSPTYNSSSTSYKLVAKKDEYFDWLEVQADRGSGYSAAQVYIGNLKVGDTLAVSNLLNGNEGDVTFISGGELNIVPNTDNLAGLGRSNQRWKDIYLGGNLSDGTNSITVAEIASRIASTGLYRHIIDLDDILYYSSSSGWSKSSNHFQFNIISKDSTSITDPSDLNSLFENAVSFYVEWLDLETGAVMYRDFPTWCGPAITPAYSDYVIFNTIGELHLSNNQWGIKKIQAIVDDVQPL